MGPLLASIGTEVIVHLLRVTAVLLLAALTQWALPRRTSAATRHMVWTASLALVLALPLVAWAAPGWTLEIRRVVAPSEDIGSGAATAASHERATERPLSTAPAITSSTGAEAKPSSPVATAPWTDQTWRAVLGLVYLAGVLAVAVQVLRQRIWMRRACREAAPIHDESWRALLQRSADQLQLRDAMLLRSGGHLVPMTCGTWRPTVLLPRLADTWEEERRHAVLLHELAHVARRDCLTQLIASLACAVAWCHPAAWWVARRMRHERELACDDRVVASGTPARGYAGHLLDIAYAYADVRVPTEVLAMARPRQIETRLHALLDCSRNRRPAPAWAAVLLAAGALVVLLPVATVRARVVSVAPERLLAVVASNPRPDAVLATSASDVKDVMGAVAGVIEAAQAAITTHDDEGSTGTWSVRPSDSAEAVHLEMRHGRSMSGNTVRVDRFKGLAEALQGNGGAATRFELVRDAGTIVFEGVFRNRAGGGTFSFVPDATFGAALERRGFTRPTARQQVQMARHDVGFALIDALEEHRYTKPDTAALLRAGQHGVTATYVREMAAAGIALGALDRLVTLRDHGVTPTYVQEMAALGYKGLDADQLQRARDHGVTPDYVRGMAQAGHAGLPLDAVIKARDHGVTPEYLRGLAEAGYKNLPLDEATRVRDHGVTPEYLRGMRDQGHTGSLAELVRARDHGVSLEYVREMAGLGLKDVPLDGLIRLRDHGVSAGYVKELAAAGYTRLSPDQLVSLRDHGMTASRIEAANTRAGSRLSVEDLLDARRHGSAR